MENFDFRFHAFFFFGVREKGGREGGRERGEGVSMHCTTLVTCYLSSAVSQAASQRAFVWGKRREKERKDGG